MSPSTTASSARPGAVDDGRPGHDPAVASARLAEWGLQLLRGQVILTGSALPLFPVKPGSRVVAEARPLGTSSVEID